MFVAQRAATKDAGISSVEYPTAKEDLNLDLIGMIKSRAPASIEPSTPQIEEKN